ncbi:MAG: HAD hydrolase-like protein [Parcubacteria group bacterium]|nr:HAD hydrolase-like protein [Parcubacteria group bacterium]
MKIDNAIKALTFDWDGTILDTTDKSIESHICFAHKKNLRIPAKQELKKLWGLHWPDVIQKIWPEIDSDKFIAEYINFDKNVDFLLINGSLETLKSLKNSGYLLTILTSRDKYSLQAHIKKLRIPDDLFSFIQTPENSKYVKPHPNCFQETLAFLNKRQINRKNIIYIGDTVYDYEIAKHVNIDFIGVLSGSHKKNDFLQAGLEERRIVRSISELGH